MANPALRIEILAWNENTDTLDTVQVTDTDAPREDVLRRAEGLRFSSNLPYLVSAPWEPAEIRVTRASDGEIIEQWEF